MKQQRVARISSLVGVVCAVGLAGVGSWQNLEGISFSSAVAGTVDSVSRYGQHFYAAKIALADQLGSTSGQIGYVSDMEPDSAEGTETRFLAEYWLAPFVLAPGREFPLGLLDPEVRQDWQPPPAPEANPEWFIGNFSPAANAAKVASRNGLVVVRDFGAGVLLLRRAPR